MYILYIHVSFPAVLQTTNFIEGATCATNRYGRGKGRREKRTSASEARLLENGGLYLIIGERMQVYRNRETWNLKGEEHVYIQCSSVKALYSLRILY